MIQSALLLPPQASGESLCTSQTESLLSNVDHELRKLEQKAKLEQLQDSSNTHPSGGQLGGQQIFKFSIFSLVERPEADFQVEDMCFDCKDDLVVPYKVLINKRSTANDRELSEKITPGT